MDPNLFNAPNELEILSLLLCESNLIAYLMLRILRSGSHFYFSLILHMFQQLSDSSANVTHTDPSNNKSTEGLQCSNSFLRNKEAEPTSHLQAIMPCSNCGFRQDIGGKQRTNELVNSLEAIKSNGHLLNPANIKAGSVPQVQHGNMTVGANPSDNSAGSSSEASREAYPASFQFFVTSEEGINLYVDLSLSPSDWVRRLKDEVCVYRKVHHSESRVLHRELGCLGDADEFIKHSMAECPGTSLQNRGVERNADSVPMRSSLSSIGIDNSHCGAHNPDETNEPSGSTPVGIIGHSDEAKRVVSSSLGKPDSDLQSEVGPVSALPQSSPTTAVKMATSIDGQHCLNSSECRTSKSTSIYHKNAEARIVGVSSMVSGVSEKSSLPFFGGACEDFSSPQDRGCLEKHGEVCQGSSASGATEIHLMRGVRVSGSSTSINHLADQPKLDSPPKGIQLDKTQAAEYQPVLGRCCGVGSPDAGDQISAFPEEQERGAIVNEKENSDCSQSAATTGKRSHESELPEELQSKRQRSDDEDKDNVDIETTIKSLRNPKNSAREQLPPRRSMRLVPKV